MQRIVVHVVMGCRLSVSVAFHVEFQLPLIMYSFLFVLWQVDCQHWWLYYASSPTATMQYNHGR